MRILSPSEQDNRPCWDWKRRGYYEVWYFKFNLPEQELAFWFRYTLLLPGAPTQISLAELWAIAFGVGSDKQHIALKQSFPIKDYQSNPANFLIRIGESVLSQDKTVGMIQHNAHQISWNLSYPPNQSSYHHIPPLLRKAPLPKTKVCSPHVNTTYTGEVTLDNRSYSIQNAPGMQGHIWGTQYAHNWVWAHCNTFEEEPDTVLEALSGRIKLGSGISPPLSPIYIRYKGQDYYFNSYLDLLKNTSSYRAGAWEFEVQAKDLRFSVTLTADLARDSVGVKYTDPDGSHRYCYNTKIGQARLEIKRQIAKTWETEAILHAHHTCAIEWVFSEPLDGIPILI